MRSCGVGVGDSLGDGLGVGDVLACGRACKPDGVCNTRMHSANAITPKKIQTRDKAFPLLTSTTSTRTLAFLDELGQLGNDLKEIAHNTKIAELKDWRVGILIDGYDNACTAHADFVLNRS